MKNKFKIILIFTLGVILFSSLWFFLAFKEKTLAIWVGYISILISTFISVIIFSLNESISQGKKTSSRLKVNYLLAIYFLISLFLNIYFMLYKANLGIALMAIQFLLAVVNISMSFMLIAATRSTSNTNVPKVNLENPLRGLEVRVRAIKNDISYIRFEEEILMLYENTVFIDTTLERAEDNSITDLLEEIELDLVSGEKSDEEIKEKISSLSKKIRKREIEIRKEKIKQEG